MEPFHIPIIIIVGVVYSCNWFEYGIKPQYQCVIKLHHTVKVLKSSGGRMYYVNSKQSK